MTVKQLAKQISHGSREMEIGSKQVSSDPEEERGSHVPIQCHVPDSATRICQECTIGPKKI